jgi:hypothetical protein
MTNNATSLGGHLMEKIINKGYLSAVSSGWCCLGTIQVTTEILGPSI